MIYPHNGPRPLATFDPTPDGYEPVPLSGTIAALQRLTDAIKDARAALAGCTTPLNLTHPYGSVRDMESVADEQLDQLLRAAALIEADVPLAGRFTGEQPWAERSNAVLSPRQILVLADMAAADTHIQHVTYREVINSTENAVPSIIVSDRYYAAQARWNADRDEFQDLILEDIESHPCPMCGAAPGSYCRTKTGRMGGPHVGRKRLSQLALEYPAIAKLVKREDEETAELFREEGGQRELERQRLLEDRGIVGEVVGELAERIALKDDR